MFNATIKVSKRFAHLHEQDIEIDAVLKSDNIAWLLELFDMLQESEELLHGIASGYKRVGLNDHFTLKGVGGKLGYLRLAKRAVEQRLNQLGTPVPYPENDIRNQKIRELEARVKELEGTLAEERRHPAVLIGEAA